MVNLGLSFKQTMMGPSPQGYIPSHKVIGPLVLEKKIFEGFYRIWAWRPSCSCDPDPTNKLLFPHSTEALIGQKILEKKIFENGGRWMDGWTTTMAMLIYFLLFFSFQIFIDLLWSVQNKKRLQ